MKCIGPEVPVLRLTALLLLFFLVVCARAQEQLVAAGKPSSREIAVTIKVSSNNPGSVHGLSKDDFKLAIGGKPRPYFRQKSWRTRVRPVTTP
jgi:hypothetical protein